MKKNGAFAIFFVALFVVGCESESEECQICHIDYSYEYTDTDSNGDPVTATESGRESSDEGCGSEQDLKEMKATVEGDAVSFELDLASQGAQNISTTVTCEKSE